MKKNITRRLMTALLAAVMCVSMAACGSKTDDTKTDGTGDADGAKKYTIGVCQLMTHDALDAATQGFIDAVRDRTSREDGDLTCEVHVRLGVGPSARAGGRFLHSYEDQIAQFPGDTAGRHLAQAREWGTAEMWPEP